MDDVIEIQTTINPSGFQRGCKELRGAISSMSKTAGKMTGIIKKAVAVVIGIGSVYQATTKAAKTFMSQNDNVSRRLQSVWTALGNVLAPVIEGIVSGVVNAVSYMLSFLKLVGVQAGSPATSTKGNGKAKADMKNTVSGFDELNVLSDNSGSGSAANKAGLADIEPTVWMKNLAGLLISGQFVEAGKEVAEKLNQIVSAIDWKGAGKKIAACFKGAIDFLGNAVRDFDIRSLSKNLTRSLNSAMYADSEGESAWESSGRLLYARFTSVLDFRTGFFSALDWGALAKAYSDFKIGEIEAITRTIEKTDWEHLGKRLYEALRDIVTNIDFTGWYTSASHFVGAYYGAWGGLIAGCLEGAFEEITG